VVIEEPNAIGSKQRLLDAAERHFGERGFDGASLRAICEEADVNLASVKYYFGDKEGLFIETVKQAHVCSTMSDSKLELPTGPPVKRLEGFIRIMVSRMFAPARLSAMKLMMRELAEPGKAAHIVVKEYIQPMAFLLRDILAEFVPHLPEQKRYMLGFSIMGQALYYRQNRNVTELIFGKEVMDSLTMEMVADHVVQFTLNSLGFQPRPEGSS
jgi:AcrR family transcriptional regulator